MKVGPQGLIMVPILYLIFINVLQIGKLARYILFGDDTTLTIHDDNLANLIVHRARHSWRYRAGIMPNKGKTREMLFLMRDIGDFTKPLEVKFLEVYLDPKLT